MDHEKPPGLQWYSTVLMGTVRHTPDLVGLVYRVAVSRLGPNVGSRIPRLLVDKSNKLLKPTGRRAGVPKIAWISLFPSPSTSPRLMCFHKSNDRQTEPNIRCQGCLVWCLSGHPTNACTQFGCRVRHSFGPNFGLGMVASLRRLQQTGLQRTSLREQKYSRRTATMAGPHSTWVSSGRYPHPNWV
jgi:hypothetical protein